MLAKSAHVSDFPKDRGFKKKYIAAEKYAKTLTALLKQLMKLGLSLLKNSEN